MTLSQLSSLTEDELAMCLYIVNVLQPTEPPLEIPAKGLVWFKRDALIKKVTDVFPQVKPEYHSIYLSLLEKMGVKVEIHKQPPPAPQEPSASAA